MFSIQLWLLLTTLPLVEEGRTHALRPHQCPSSSNYTPNITTERTDTVGMDDFAQLSYVPYPSTTSKLLLFHRMLTSSQVKFLARQAIEEYPNEHAVFVLVGERLC